MSITEFLLLGLIWRHEWEPHGLLLSSSSFTFYRMVLASTKSGQFHLLKADLGSKCSKRFKHRMKITHLVSMWKSNSQAWLIPQTLSPCFKQFGFPSTTLGLRSQCLLLILLTQSIILPLFPSSVSTFYLGSCIPCKLLSALCSHVTKP